MSFTQDHIDAWRRDSALVIPGFFSAEETAAVIADFDLLYAERERGDEALVKFDPGETGRFHPAQFKGVQPVPLPCSPALNLIGTHPALVAFAKQAMGCDDVRLYQCQAWGKFTGEADYEQPFHCDYVNHTLTGPSDDPKYNSVTFICLFSDVTEAHGPTHYVPRSESLEIAGPQATLNNLDETLQARLRQHARSAAGPAGSVFVYGIDVWHRGTNLVAPGGHRYVMTVCYRDVRNDAINFHAWPFTHTKPWKLIFENADPEQLACFGVQRPGDPFWTETTLARAQARWPGWDMTPYREALAAGAEASA